MIKALVINGLWWTCYEETVFLSGTGVQSWEDIHNDTRCEQWKTQRNDANVYRVAFNIEDYVTDSRTE